MAELGAPYVRLWRLLSTRYGELEAARVVAKLVGAIVEHGEQLVADTAGAVCGARACGAGSRTGGAGALPSGVDPCGGV